MTATDKLRRLLDERGVEHYDHENGEPLRDLSEAGPDPATSWRMGDASVCAVPDKNGTLDIWIDHATPEQAIAATLGNDGVGRSNDGVAERKTCRRLPQRSNCRCEVHNGHFSASFGYWTCSECGVENFEGAKYCMNCGAEVVE